MRGGIEAFDGYGGFDGHLDGDILNGIGRETLGVEGVGISDHAGIEFQGLIVGKVNAFFAIGRDGIDAGAEHVASDIFKKTGVLHAADDVLIDFAGLVLFKDFARDAFAVHVEGELADGGILGKGEDICSFKVTPVRIPENLVNAGFRHLAFDLDFDTVIFDRECLRSRRLRRSGARHNMNGRGVIRGFYDQDSIGHNEKGKAKDHNRRKEENSFHGLPPHH